MRKNLNPSEGPFVLKKCPPHKPTGFYWNGETNCFMDDPKKATAYSFMEAVALWGNLSRGETFEPLKKEIELFKPARFKVFTPRPRIFDSLEDATNYAQSYFEKTKNIVAIENA